MPARRQGQSEEQKKAAYDAFMNGNEAKLIRQIFEIRKQDEGDVHELAKFEQGTDDIVGKWEDILKWLHDLVVALKVPGTKSKGKLHFMLPFSDRVRVFSSLRAKLLPNDVLQARGVRVHRDRWQYLRGCQLVELGPLRLQGKVPQHHSHH